MTNAQNSVDQPSITAETLLDWFAQRDWVADSINDYAVQSGVSVSDDLVLPLIVQIDKDVDCVYVRMVLFPGATVRNDSNFARLLELADLTPVVKLGLHRADDGTRELVAAVEYPLYLVDHDLFDFTIDMLIEFYRAFHEAIEGAVKVDRVVTNS